MTTHTIFSALDSPLPATRSPVITQRLPRQELGFGGVVTSDGMEIEAITDHFTPAQTAVLWAQAGLDVILFSHARTMQEAAYDGLLDAARHGQVSGIEEANERIAAIKRAHRAHQPDLAMIHQPEHVDLMLKAARAGTAVLRGGDRLRPAEGAALVEFASHLESGILESGGSTGFATQLRRFSPALWTTVFCPPLYAAETIRMAEELARSAPTLVLATRNAHLNADQLAVARRLTQQASRVILVCLRNPHDAEALVGTDAIVCTCGDSAPSLQAAAEALNGVFVPAGQIPVSARLSGTNESRSTL